ncbi:MAG: HD domain-containing protein [Candidatus Bathyarchaeia archaeon]
MALASYSAEGDFASDIDRIIYSNAFRRMANKSQIIIKPTRDHFRSRLIHTEEVNRIALAIGKELGLNLDLVSATAMAHDIGHTPFGHAGEQALRMILEREVTTRFGATYPRKKAEREEFTRNIFHHSLNSARMLIKDVGGISREIITGVLTHSWSPWKKDPTFAVPRSYEAQVVAVADQIASINHDTEDIIEGSPYTEYDIHSFSERLVRGFRKKFQTSYDNLEKTILTFVVDKTVEPGYGRQSRIDQIVADIVENTRRMFKQEKVSQSAQAELHPITLSDDWSNFLWFYEKSIRDLIQEEVSWFIGRDNMAGALISTVFNYLWPRVRTSGAVMQLSLSVFERRDIVKTKIDEKGKYIDHFSGFFNEHYRDEDQNRDIYTSFLNDLKKIDVSTWDLNILRSLKKKLSPEENQIFARLVAVIDFIAGLTDRYCLEIFDEVYHEFVLT